MNHWTKRVLTLVAWWLWIPVLYLLMRGIVALLFSGHTWGRAMDQWLMANILSGGGWLWIMLTFGFIGTGVILLAEWLDGETGPPVSQALGVVSLVLALVMIGQTVRVEWDNDKDFGRYYNAATTFYVSDTDEPPTSLNLLFNDARQSNTDKCDLVGGADVPSCIKQGTLSEAGWDARVGSLDGAKIALRRTTGDAQRVSLNVKTLTYLNAGGEQQARWSGIMDGKGRQQPMAGVAEWEGSGQPTQCQFEGQFELDRAFGGERMNSLPNLLAEKYPALRWNISDVWGYCDGDEPIVVIPMTRQMYFKDRTVDTAGGIVTVRGDNGDTKLEHFSSVKPRQFPGPVYPMSLVVKQRDEMRWAAGRKNAEPSRGSFGYDPATSEAQAGNVSEYLLRNADTGRLEWVTPLTLRGSSSELFVAYAVTPADTVADNQFNELSVYVLDEDDPRRINIDNLEADARNFLATNAGTFISNGGKLIEFTPVDGDLWRAFGELNGRVVYRLDISAGNNIRPKLVNIGPSSESDEEDPDEPSNAACGNELTELSPKQLGECLRVFTDELVKRQEVATGTS